MNKNKLKRSCFVWLLPHITLAGETFPALLVSEESSGSLKVPSALGSRGKKEVLIGCFPGYSKELYEGLNGGIQLSVVG